MLLPTGKIEEYWLVVIFTLQAEHLHKQASWAFTQTSFNWNWNKWNWNFIISITQM